MIEFFTNPILRGPTLASMLMALSASLVGVIVFVRRRSLLGETLSHATYPGVALALALIGSWAAPVGAFLFALLALACLARIKSQDAGQLFILSAFFGVGVTIASRIQFTHPVAFMQIERYLYGQAATMTDIHIALYGALSLVVVALVFLFYKEIQISSFDRGFAKALGLKLHVVDTFILLLIALSIVVGIRTVGVVMMSAMLIAPATAARQFTHRLSTLFLLSGLFGVVSAFFGVILSRGLPTGPMIVLIATTLAVLSLFFAPRRGLLLRLIRIQHFRQVCLQENILKGLWRDRPIKKRYRFALSRLRSKGYLTPEGKLTSAGRARARHLVRLHRLWEVYLADYLGVGAERVHHSAEEMEHIITPALEEELVRLMGNPKTDPHNQPIP